MLGNKEVMSKNIKKYMKIKNVDRRRMSKDLKVSYTTLSDWINAKTYPRIDKIELMANYFGVSKSDLVENGNAVSKVPIKEIPILSQISAGLPLYSEQNINSYRFIADTLTKDGKEYFGLIVSGDSMDKEFKDGDVVIIEKDSEVPDGKIGVIQINGYNATLKRVRYNNDSIVLLPESNNPEHAPQFYNHEDEVTIIGRVVGLQRDY